MTDPHTRLALAAVMATAAPAAAALAPASVESFFVTPGEASKLRWRAEPATPVPYAIRDYWGKAVAAGRCEAADGAVEVTVTLAQGFYDIEFPATKQRFGIVSLAAHGGTPDAFFAVDAAMSWLVKADATREGLVKALRRSGIAMSRERLSWAQVSPAADKWDFQTPQRYERLRKTYAACGVPLLEMFHDAPPHLGRVGKYPADLVGAARAWDAIARRLRPTWGALEVWNEPDIFFGADLPADQYVPLVKTIAWTLASRRIDTPLVAGVFAHYNRPYLDNAAANGMLDWLDAASFHTYGRAPQMEDLIGKYRSWLGAHGRESMPLWITECGRPWRVGPSRPPADQAAASALDITMKAIESRACGIARYFAFVYPYYEEHANNFGMMGKAATPLRSFAAYARLASLLAGKQYMGDLRCDDKAVQRVRVFGDRRETVAAIYTGRADGKAAVKLGLHVSRAAGIDGRRLEQTAGGDLPVPDGLAYVWLSRADLEGRLLTDVPAMRLWRLGRQRPPQRIAPSPIVLRYEFDRGVVDAGSRGYRLKTKPPEKLPMVVKAFNLSAVPRPLTLTASFSPPGAKLVTAAERPLKLPPEGSAVVDWQADLREAFAASNWITFRVTAAGANGEALAKLTVDLQGEATLDQMLRGHARRVRLPVHEPSRWTPNIAGGGRMTVGRTDEGHWRLTAKFGKGDPWVYPFFRLPKDVSFDAAKGLLIRARCHAPADVRVFLWEGETGVGYLTASPIIPADGQWHAALVRFDELSLSTANAPDPNHRLDLDRVRRISIGLNSKARENTLDVSDLYLVGGD